MESPAVQARGRRSNPVGPAEQPPASPPEQQPEQDQGAAAAAPRAAAGPPTAQHPPAQSSPRVLPPCRVDSKSSLLMAADGNSPPTHIDSAAAEPEAEPSDSGAAAPASKLPDPGAAGACGSAAAIPDACARAAVEAALEIEHACAADEPPPRFSWKAFCLFVGPGLLMSVAYLDPGNLQADVTAGAQTGYSLLWWFAADSLICVSGGVQEGGGWLAALVCVSGWVQDNGWFAALI